MTRQPHRSTMPARGEDGYAMVVTVTVITILTLLLVAVLAQALHNNTASTGGVRRSRALGVAEAGVSWAIAALDANPSTAVVTNRAVPVADGSGGTGTATVTVRRARRPTRASSGTTRSSPPARSPRRAARPARSGS
jgi:Tfp pilus assembly protein PilX